MDRWKYFGITHRDHLVCNPTSSAKLDEFVGLLPLRRDARVLDVACGKAELLLRIADRHHVSGVGIDLSPYEVEAARQRVATRDLGDRIKIVESDGAEYDAAPHSFDLAMCIGATWVWGGYPGTIEALKAIAAPEGLIAIGEPFKKREPAEDYIAADPEVVPALATHADNVAMAQERGLKFLYALVSNQDDWDRYEGLQTLAAELYAAEHPDDPDIDELLTMRHEYDRIYLNWARDTLNWAIYLFKAPAE